MKERLVEKLDLWVWGEREVGTGCDESSGLSGARDWPASEQW